MGRHVVSAGWLGNACTDDMSPHVRSIRTNAAP
jgi:hypothetical protein